MIARYEKPPLLVEALRRSSREIVDAEQVSCRAISRTPCPWTRNSAICSRSSSDKYRLVAGGDDGERCDGGMPPCSRNHLVPTAGDTPAIRAASSLERPAAIACQNGRRSARCRTGGRPGDLIFARPTRTFFAPIVTSIPEVLRQPVEPRQFTGYDWLDFLKAHGLRPSMSRRGNCHDNAVAESFFQLLKRERIRRRTYATREQARQDVFDYIEMFYNPKRRHGNNNRLSPVEFERRYFTTLASV